VRPQPKQLQTEASEQTRLILDHLRDMVEDSDIPRREIEDRAGFSRGYLTQILGGRAPLKLAHLAAILEGIDASFASFFGEVFPSWPPRRGQRGYRLPAVNRNVLGVYGHGLTSVHEFRERLARCEDALGKLKANGMLDGPP